MKEKGMKKTKENIDIQVDDLLPEYNIDYTKVQKNPYYKKNRIFVEIDEDIANVFRNPKDINKVLKAIIKSFPKNSVAI